MSLVTVTPVFDMLMTCCTGFVPRVLFMAVCPIVVALYTPHQIQQISQVLSAKSLPLLLCPGTNAVTHVSSYGFLNSDNDIMHTIQIYT